MNFPTDGFEPDTESAVTLLAAVVTDVAPPMIRRGILNVVAARPRFRSVPLAPVEALAALVTDVGELLESLTDDDWETAAALGDLSVRDTVSHLTGADRYLGVKTGAWSEPLADELDHLATSRPAIEAGISLTNTELLDRWRSNSGALIAHLRTIPVADMSLPSRYNVIAAPLGGVLIARAFELWTHAEDICRATGRSLRPPAADVLGAMTDVAAELVPGGYQLETGRTDPQTVRLVLTGPGGGTWDRALTSGAMVGEPDVVVVAESVDFCRLIANRLAPVDLDCEIIGEQTIGHAVVAGAMRFAMD